MMLNVGGRAGAAASGGPWSVRNVNATVGTSTTLAVTAGDLIVVYSASYTSAANLTVADTVNTYGEKLMVNLGDIAGRCSAWCWVAIAASTATLTITVSGTNVEAVHAGAFYRAGSTPSTTADVTGFEGGDLDNSIVLATTVADTLLTGMSDASGANNVGSGFTSMGSTVNNLRLRSEYNPDEKASGNHTVNTIDGSPNEGIIAVAFKFA